MARTYFEIHKPALSVPQILRALASLIVLLFLIFNWHLNTTAAVSEAFRCSWKIVQSRGVYPFSSIELDQTGNGVFRFQKLQSELVTADLHISRSKVALLYNLFRQASFLNQSKNFPSEKKVADLGMKTIRFETGKLQREVTFNYTEDKTLKEINDFFENLAEQEKMLFEIELALKYDRLGIPKKLDFLEKEFSANRIVAPERFKPILTRISEDDSLMNLARKEARKLLSRVSKMQPQDY